MPDVNATLAERGARYGDFTDHALIAQRIQDAMRDTPGWQRLSPVHKQALTVIADKQARILSGDPNYTDNWHDIQGYARLAEDRCVDTTSPQLPLDAASHLVRQESDEYVCSRCHRRWGVDEDAPEQCA